jgi:sulfur-carrier protein adenylyltransferase/sulfurtransferase
MSIEEITPGEARRRCDGGGLLVDVRTGAERAAGMARGAMPIEQAVLERESETRLPDREAPLMLICQSGGRSLHLAALLLQRGYRNVASVQGGTERWLAEGLPVTVDGEVQDPDFHARYARHLRLPEIGLEGQRALESSRVLLVGAGGLGSPAAYYLAAAGVGELRIADHDVVDRSNLQRQIIHADAEVGQPKVASAQRRIAALNPRTRVAPVPERMTPCNVEQLLSGVDVAIDGADNFPARYLLNDACIRLGVPLVYGAVHRFEGQVSVFDAGRRRGHAPCYRCLFPEPPAPEAAPNCSEAGVLGVLPGVIGLLQATEAIKLLLGLGDPLTGRLLHFDALAMRFRETRLMPDPDCALCAPGRAFPGYADDPDLCRGGEPT